MSVIARFSVPADRFALGDVLEVREGIRVRLESMVPTGSSTVPHLWVPSDDADAVLEALRGSSLVADVRLVDETGSEALVRVDWTSDVNGLVDAIDGSGAVVLEAKGLGDSWSFRLRFPDHQQLSEFYRSCVEGGVDPDLHEVNSPLGPDGDSEDNITGAQREALLTALEEGYFEVPRKTTLQEVADQLDISDTALSQRLRRGLSGVLTSTLTPQAEAGHDERPPGTDRE
jgi:predicted DNA binding protein